MPITTGGKTLDVRSSCAGSSRLRFPPHHLRSEIARRFPDLRTLDQTPIDPSTIAFQTKRDPVVVESISGASPAARRDAAKAKREPIVFPLPIKQGFFESDSTRDFIGGFLLK